MKFVAMFPGRSASVSFQFSASGSPLPFATRLGFVQAWAARFGTEVVVSGAYHQARFTQGDIEFNVYTVDRAADQ